MLLAVDESLGRILAALERKGVLNETMVVFTSDHGYFYGEHGLNEERRLAYEEAIRIPLLMRYPSLAAAGSTRAEMVLNLDMAPTFLELAGLQPGAHIQGRSLVPVLKGEAKDWRTSFLIEYYTDTVFPRVRNMGYVAVRTARHKYINYNELPGMSELYDLEADPYEETNLVDRPEGKPALEQAQAELRRLIEQTGYTPPAPAAKGATKTK
jgi:N-acetylglucosamine-6-sulfatase